MYRKEPAVEQILSRLRNRKGFTKYNCATGYSALMQDCHRLPARPNRPQVSINSQKASAAQMDRHNWEACFNLWEISVHEKRFPPGQPDLLKLQYMLIFI